MITVILVHPRPAPVGDGSFELTVMLLGVVECASDHVVVGLAAGFEFVE